MVQCTKTWWLCRRLKTDQFTVLRPVIVKSPNTYLIIDTLYSVICLLTWDMLLLEVLNVKFKGQLSRELPNTRYDKMFSALLCHVLKRLECISDFKQPFYRPIIAQFPEFIFIFNQMTVHFLHTHPYCIEYFDHLQLLFNQTFSIKSCFMNISFPLE